MKLPLDVLRFRAAGLLFRNANITVSAKPAGDLLRHSAEHVCGGDPHTLGGVAVPTHVRGQHRQRRGVGHVRRGEWACLCVWA